METHKNGNCSSFQMIKDNKPKISIGMPVWNGEPFIKDALHSILNQTYVNFELIISDNGSNDQTEEICKYFKSRDERIKYYRSPVNKGGFNNFMSVLNKSDGDYFMWAAADDQWDINWLEVLIEDCLKTNSIAFGNLRQIDSFGKIIPYATNNRNLTFSGLSIIRRMKFFFYPGVLGKANLIYALYPKKILTPQSLSVLGGKFKHSDMLFIYQLLKNNNIKANLNTFFYKRVSENYKYSVNGNDKLKKNKKITLENIICGVKNITGYYQGYFSISTKYELLILMFIFPCALFYDIAIRIFWSFRLRNI
jgi:glycosyltransferase involved in cell wall biosynthesis